MNGPLQPLGDKNYDVYIRQFNRFGRGRRVAPRIVPFIESLKRKGCAPSTVNHARSALWKSINTTLSAKGRYESLARFRLLFDQIKIRRQTEVVTRDMILSAEAKDRFKELCIDGNDHRYALIVEFIWQTGSRIGVAMQIRLGDCKVDGETVSYYTSRGKGGRPNQLNWTLGLHREIVREFGSVTHLFQARRGQELRTHLSTRSVQRFFRRRSSASPKRVWPHLLRHSCATHLLDAGANAKEIALWLNHSSVTTTLNIYCHQDREAAAQLARLAPTKDSLNHPQRPRGKSA